MPASFGAYCPSHAIAHQLISPTSFDPHKAEKAVMMLAQGIVACFQRALEGHVLRQNRDTPRDIHDAQSMLAELYLLEGKEDISGDFHGLMARCRRPFTDPAWQLECLAHPDFPYRDVALVRNSLSAPTPDCIELAQMGGMRGVANLHEYFAHRRLRDMVDDVRQLVPDAYRLLREGIARNSLVSEMKLTNYLVESDLGQLRAELRLHYFDRVPKSLLINGLAYRCASCHTLMHPHRDPVRYPHGMCPIPSCAGFMSSEALDPVKDGELLVAKPHILEYWVAPALDELRIYDRAVELGLSVVLYPGEDLADVGFGEGRECGADVKGYASPVLLAHRLRNNIGGLAKFGRRILVISDYCFAARPDYKERLREQWTPNCPAWSLEIVTVSEMLQMLEERPRG